MILPITIQHAEKSATEVALFVTYQDEHKTVLPGESLTVLVDTEAKIGQSVTITPMTNYQGKDTVLENFDVNEFDTSD